MTVVIIERTRRRENVSTDDKVDPLQYSVQQDVLARSKVVSTPTHPADVVP